MNKLDINIINLLCNQDIVEFEYIQNMWPEYWIQSEDRIHFIKDRCFSITYYLDFISICLVYGYHVLIPHILNTHQNMSVFTNKYLKYNNMLSWSQQSLLSQKTIKIICSISNYVNCWSNIINKQVERLNGFEWNGEILENKLIIFLIWNAKMTYSVLPKLPKLLIYQKIYVHLF